MLDAQDEVALTVMGEYIMEDVVGVVCETIWWAAYLTLFCVAMYIQLNKGIRTVGSTIMLATTLLLFASSTALWAMDISVLFIRQKHRMLLSKDLPLEDRIAYSNTFITSFGTSMEALFMFNMIVGDSVVIWRAWVLWTGDRIRKIMIVPVTLLLVSLVFAIIDINCLVEESYGSKSTIPSGSRTCRWAEPISWAISLLTNIAATALIAAKAWEHRQLLRTGIGRSGMRSKGEKILILLVESGFVYCLFWLTQLLDFFDIPRATGGVFYLYLVVSTMGDQISGLYPTLIIILVKLQQSVHDDTVYMSQFRASADISTSTRFTGVDKTRSTHAVETAALDSYHAAMPHESDDGEGWRSAV